MNERDIFEAVSDFDESKIVKKSSEKGFGGVFHGRKWLAVTAICLASLLICGTAFGAAAALGWIGIIRTEEVTYSDGTEDELYIYAYELTDRVDPADFSEKLNVTVDDPKGKIPKEQLAGGYVPGKFFDEMFFYSAEDAIEFVGIDGLKTFDELGLKLIPDTCVGVSAGKNNGEISYASINLHYNNVGNGVNGPIISIEIYSSAYNDDELLGNMDKDMYEAYKVTTASDEQGVKFISKKPLGGNMVYIVLIPDGPIVYQLYFTSALGAEKAADEFINSWLALM